MHFDIAAPTTPASEKGQLLMSVKRNTHTSRHTSRHSACSYNNGMRAVDREGHKEHSRKWHSPGSQIAIPR